MPLTPFGKKPPEVTPVGGFSVVAVETPYTAPRSCEVVRAGEKPNRAEPLALPLTNTVKYWVGAGG